MFEGVDNACVRCFLEGLTLDTAARRSVSCRNVAERTLGLKAPVPTGRNGGPGGIGRHKALP